jgi:hypothetical protein
MVAFHAGRLTTSAHFGDRHLDAAPRQVDRERQPNWPADDDQHFRKGGLVKSRKKAFDIAPPSNSDNRVESEALSRKVLWEARTAQLDLLCACGRRPVELKVLGCCRLCYQRHYHSVR